MLPIQPNKIEKTVNDQAYWELSNQEKKTHLSSKLCEILEQIDKKLLGKINQEATLLEHGLQSLSILQFVSQIEKQIGVMLPLATIGSLGKLVDIANILHEELDKTSNTIKPKELDDAIQTKIDVNRNQPFALTDVQRAYWIGKNASLELGGIGTHFYNEYEPEYLDLPRLNKAVNQMIQRHSMLRCIVNSDGKQQILSNVQSYEIMVINLIGMDEAEKTEQEQNTRELMSNQVLPSDTWPLFDIQVVVLGLQKYQIRIYIDNLIFDASSYATFLHELGIHYEQSEHSLPSLNYEFQDYVLTNQKHKGTITYQESIEFWNTLLRDMPPRPELTLIQQPAQIKIPHTKRVENRLPAEKWEQLKLIAQDKGCTVSTLLMNIYADLLNLWSKTSQFTISMTVFNRPAYHDQINNILGDFTNIIFIPVDRSKSQSFQERANDLQQQIWMCLDHKQVEMGEVQRIYQQLHQEMAEAMPVVFTSLLGSEWGEPYSSSWLGNITYNMTQTPQVWIDHVVLEAHGDLVYFFDYVEELFPDGYIEAMFNAYEQQLDLLLQESGWQEKSLTHLLPANQRDFREQFNTTKDSYPTLCLHELFEKQVECQNQDQIAVLAPGKSLTYREVENLANQTANHLQQQSISSNELVAVVMDKGWEQVVAVLGILKAGAAYLPISPSLPQDRLNLLLKSGKVKHVLTQKDKLLSIKWPNQVKCLDISEQSLQRYSSKRSNLQYKTNSLAYVIYTSGSTGTPKGVMIDHQGAVNTIYDINQRFGVTSKDRIMALSSLSFDLSVYDVFGILSAGGAIVFPEVEREHDLRHWYDLIQEYQVTIWNTVPALMGLLVESMSKRNLTFPQSLRVVMMSGDWIPIELTKQIQSVMQGGEVYSLGGATEASIWSIYYPIEKLNPAWSSIPYGSPLKNQRIYLLDQQFNPTPDWVVGDLYIGGDGVALGYWDNPELTQNSFINNPNTGERLYCTGDLGRFLPEGHVEFLGRRDSQVKIRGYRVELGEIESQLTKIPVIDRAAVITIGEEKSIRALVAYVTLKQNAETDYFDSSLLSSFLKKSLNEQLPDYMVPSHYVLLDQLPLTDNGKVNKNKLPSLVENLDETVKGEAATTPVQKVLVHLCCEVANINDIGIQDNFFSLGYDSLQIIQLIEQIREILEFDFTMREILSHPSITQLEQLIYLNEENFPMVEQLAELFLKIESLSNEELEKQLAPVEL